jgi:hypothetical protein
LKDEEKPANITRRQHTCLFFYLPESDGHQGVSPFNKTAEILLCVHSCNHFSGQPCRGIGLEMLYRFPSKTVSDATVHDPANGKCNPHV